MWYYIIFAVSTGIVSCRYLLYPVVQQARERGIKNVFTNNTSIAYAVYILISMVIAPVMVLPLLVNSASDNFKRGLERTVLEQD